MPCRLYEDMPDTTIVCFRSGVMPAIVKPRAGLIPIFKSDLQFVRAEAPRASIAGKPVPDRCLRRGRYHRGMPYPQISPTLRGELPEYLQAHADPHIHQDTA